MMKGIESLFSVNYLPPWRSLATSKKILPSNLWTTIGTIKALEAYEQRKSVIYKDK
jgi:hypothetical protein